MKIPNDDRPKTPEGQLPEQDPDINVIAGGPNSTVETPFVYVARTAETYAGLQNLVENLPPSSDIDFNIRTVIAVFAGQKNSGGYSVEISRESGKTAASLIAPPAGAIVTQALTNPFQIVSIPVGEQDAFQLSLSAEWTNAIRRYRVSSGEFEYSGGFVGKRVTFEPTGTVGVLSTGDYVTLIFELEGDNDLRKLTEIASGTLKDEKASLARLEAAGFIESPHPPLVISGKITLEKLSLNFEPGKRDYVVNDGYEGRGMLEAVLER